MRRFRFPAETLLSVRGHEQTICQMRVADIERQRLEVEAERDRLAAELAAMYEAARHTEAQSDLDVNAALSQARFVRLLSAQRKAAEMHLARLAKRKEQATRDLVEANRKVRLLERLRERRYTEWRGEVDREDQAFLDELGVGRFRREHGGVIGKLLALIVLVALIGGGIWAYRHGYLQPEYLKNLAGRGGAGAGGRAAEVVMPATSESPGGVALDLVRDASTGVIYFQTEQAKNFRASQVLATLEEERKRLEKKQEELAQLETDLTRRERDLMTRENDVETKWKEALDALAKNQVLMEAEQSAEARERRESIARLSKQIGAVRPNAGVEMLLNVEIEILPEVLKQIKDSNLAKILEQMAKQAAEAPKGSDEATRLSAQLKLILDIMGKVADPSVAGGEL